MKHTKLFAFVLGAAMLLNLAACGGADASEPETPASETTAQETAAGDAGQEEGGEAQTDSSDVTISEFAATHTVEITVKDYGVITVALAGEVAPITVENFVSLVESGFYDGLTFHRIIEGFMMQGGDPTGTGMGGSDETIKGEFAANGVANPLSHTRGAISMARSQSADSASSQFFIVHEDSVFLDSNYAVFGYVTDGLDVVDAVCADAIVQDANGSVNAEDQPVIESIRLAG